MAITTLAELRTAVQNWTHRSSLSTDRIDEGITMGENRLRDDLKVRAMESQATVTVNAREVTLPTGYIGMRGRFYLTTDPITRLVFVSPEKYWDTYMSTQTDKPVAFTVERENFVFGPAPDTTYTGRALIFSMAALSASNVPTLFTNHPELWLSSSMVEIAKFLDNDRMELKWDGRYQVALAHVRKANIADRHPGPLVMRPDVPIL